MLTRCLDYNNFDDQVTFFLLMKENKYLEGFTYFTYLHTYTFSKNKNCYFARV